jgi:hypothetical protein
MATTFNRKYSYNTSNIRIKIDKEAMFSEAWIVTNYFLPSKDLVYSVLFLLPVLTLLGFQELVPLK